MDGSSNENVSGAGMIFISSEGHRFHSTLRFRFEASNNEAEYEALIFGLHLATDIGVKDISVTCDSLLIVNQIQGSKST